MVRAQSLGFPGGLRAWSGLALPTNLGIARPLRIPDAPESVGICMVYTSKYYKRWAAARVGMELWLGSGPFGSAVPMPGTHIYNYPCP